ncbi:MAG TPA: putative 2OG-Fe(II) oxygenase [Kofleriaceae bacterium]
MEAFALFATPIFTFTDAANGELDRELARRMVVESEHAPGLTRSNSGGWHSVPDLSRRPEPCFQDLMERVASRVQAVFFDVARSQEASTDQRYRLGVQAWAMVMRHGDQAVLHDHTEAHFSAVYYPEVGDADLERHPDSGKLCFVDPRRGGTVISGIDLFPSQFAVTPQQGQLVVFPGWLQHFVLPYRGVQPRVSISCNVRLEATAPIT